MTPPDALPLPTLLSRVLGQLTADLEAAAGVGPTVPSLAVWSNVLRCVADAGPNGLDERALAEAARISSRLATAAVTGAKRRGWITAEPGPAGGKRRHIEFTDAGRAAAKTWPEQLAALDAEWRSSALRAALEQLVGGIDLELPHMPASYGAADPSAIGGPSAQSGKRTEGVPAHGTDWRPVRRAEGDTVSALPLTALLSQALMAFTIDYEDRFPWPLANTANVLCHLSVAPKPLADVPGDHQIAGNGKSLVERHLVAEVTRHGGTKMVALTPGRGEIVVARHPARLEGVESMWRERFGAALVTDLRDALGPLAGEASAQPDHLITPVHQG